MNKQAVRDNASKRADGNLKKMLDENDLLEMPFDFHIYLMGKIQPVLVPRGLAHGKIH